ncbi:hypothetical protein JCM17846_10650 [Iodidimonas nitroreducens]|uniref:EAL domain-containing protein n=1 Tax=Iodidimonas nitroreducens TaxID=1236968 RepID=A0A5A7N509_9PROT|nr:EAL domain-containing protein [Iodidimonas nitroreducens]GAK32287.1 cyclic di-GMP phosphodiesterase YfgF [alpha proteobacterium Q-1]GER03383.1 hypothetical protein JCM17846_10650 [Iodidimonas nitroreducens]
MSMSVFKTDLPEARPGLVRALLWASNPDEAMILSRELRAKGFTSFATDAQSVVGVFANDVALLAHVLGERLDLEQRQTTKALVLNGKAPVLSDFANIQTVEHFVHHHSSRWLVKMLDDRRFKSQVQPIVEVNGRAVMGYEFLFRGLRDDGTMVPPVEMFTAAREPNLSARLDAAARDCAVRTAARFGIPEKLFINVLPTSVSLGQSAFTDTLDLIEAAQIPPSQVVFEIVESEAVADISLLSRMINFCRNAGYSIALDDFGSGFNNLTMLIGLNPDYIKLDKSLISRISDEPPIWNLVANMIDAAKQSSVQVIAEGVEDERTARLLSALGADYMQGYLLGRPEDRPKLLD